jgi:sulfur carrier protein ThiS
MQVHVRLYGILRDQLPAEAKGRATLDLAEGASIADLLAQLGFEKRVRVARNGLLVNDSTQPLNDGDKVSVFRSASGG